MTARIARDLGGPFRGFAGRADDFDAQDRSRRANRRRFIVFGSVFAAVTFVGLVWVFSRPAVYEATARLNFVPVAPGAATSAADGAGPQYSLRRPGIRRRRCSRC